MKHEIQVGFTTEPSDTPIAVKIGDTVYLLNLEQAEVLSRQLADAIITYAGISTHELTKN